MDTVRLHTQHSSAPIFPYLYGHRGLLTFPMLFSSNVTVEYGKSYLINCRWLTYTICWLGVTHGDEVFLLFAIPFVPPLLIAGDIKASENLIDLWTSFADTG